MATNLSTVGATGRDHATMTIWEAATDLDLVVAGNIEVGECYADAGFDEHVTFEGAAGDTDISNYRILRAASGEEHDGTVGGAGVTINATTNGHLFTVHEKFLRLGSGMLIRLGTAAASDECVRVGDGTHTAEGLLIEKAILYTTNNASNIDGVYSGNWNVGSSGNPITLRNVTISGMPRGGLHAQQHSASTANDLYYRTINVTITDCGYAIGWRAAHASGTTTIKVVNAVLGDSGTADYSDTGGSNPGTNDTSGSANNYDELGEVPAGTTMTLVDTPISGVECVIETKYTDHRLQDVAENDVLLGGVGNGSNSLVPTDDFIGNDRGTGSTCDPGCHQVSAVGGGPTPGEFLRRPLNPLLRM